MDIESIQWLEDFLINAAKAVVVISHDRAFVELTLLIVLLK
jgi:ATP-binding cassette subfamily F protein 3